MDTKILELYRDPTIGMVGADAFHKKLKAMGIKIKINELKNILAQNEAYSLNRPTQKHFQTRKVIVSHVFEQLQADLVIMDSSAGAPASLNDGYKYLLTCIDVLSKFAWVVPLKSKRGEELERAIEPIIKYTGCEKFQVDKGTEFYNPHVNGLMKKYGVTMFSTNSDLKASIVERFNRTMRMRMSRMFDTTNTFRYIDDLASIVKNYNTTDHRTIGMTPEQAISPKNFDELVENFMKAGSVTGKDQTLKWVTLYASRENDGHLPRRALALGALNFSRSSRLGGRFHPRISLKTPPERVLKDNIIGKSYSWYPRK